MPFGALFFMSMLFEAETDLNLRHSPPGFPDLVEKDASEFNQNMVAIAAELPAPFGATFSMNLSITLVF